MTFVCYGTRFDLKFVTPLAVILVSFGALAQTAAPGTTKSPAPAAAPAPAQETYEQLLERYFALSFESEGFIKGIIRSYRRLPGRSDAKYSYVERPEFEKEAARVFKENWKASARKRLTTADLQYLIIFRKSALRKKLSEIEDEIFNPKAFGKIIDAIPANPVSPASPTAPPKR